VSDRLSELLGTEPPAEIAALPDRTRAQLAQLVGAARAQQGRDLDMAFAAVIKTVPLPLRPIARRILGA
jgi:hypothetical protein